METNINPRIREAEIGIKTLRKIKIYPLSIRDQIEMTDIVSQAVVGFMAAREEDNATLVAWAVSFMKENLAKVLSCVTDDEDTDALLDEITNNQAMEIGRIVYEENFAALKKTLDGVLGKKPSEGSNGPSLMSAGHTADTGLSISSEDGSKTAASP